MAYPNDNPSFDSSKVIAYLQGKWGTNRLCPMCSRGPWQVENRIFQLMEFHQGSIIVGGPVIPLIPVTCANCGNTVLVNAIKAGAVTLPHPEEAK
jgi:hypothetical protein